MKTSHLIGMAASLILLMSCQNSNDFIVDEYRKFSINLELLDPSISIKDGVYVIGKSKSKLQGVYTSKDKLSHVTFENGQPTSHQKYYSHQLLKSTHLYRNNVEHGEQRGWHANGNTSYLYTANNGIIEGIYLENFPNGNRQIERHYNDNINVAEKVYNIDGGILVNYVIKDGRYYGLLGSSNCITVMNRAYDE